MRIHCLPVVLLQLVLVAHAQPGSGAGIGPGAGSRPERTAERGVDRQQLRGELRAARELRQPDLPPAADHPAPVRHLSPRERAEMREQLRRENLLQRAVAP